MARRSMAGRPEATSHDAIEQAAFALFAERGFEGTTLDDIATAVGVTRRTLFRYYRSKNDIPWGQFDRSLQEFRHLLDAQPHAVPIGEALERAIVDFNRFPADAVPAHDVRMRLILETPALQAHSTLMYGQWRAEVSRFVARRLDVAEGDLVPNLAGHVALAVARTAYEQWLAGRHHSSDRLISLLEESLTALHEVFTPTRS